MCNNIICLNKLTKDERRKYILYCERICALNEIYKIDESFLKEFTPNYNKIIKSNIQTEILEAKKIIEEMHKN